jgi:hypothetical protein
MPILPMKKGEVHTFIRLLFTIALSLSGYIKENEKLIICKDFGGHLHSSNGINLI